MPVCLVCTWTCSPCSLLSSTHPPPWCKPLKQGWRRRGQEEAAAQKARRWGPVRCLQKGGTGTRPLRFPPPEHPVHWGLLQLLGFYRHRFGYQAHRSWCRSLQAASAKKKCVHVVRKYSSSEDYRHDRKLTFVTTTKTWSHLCFLYILYLWLHVHVHIVHRHLDLTQNFKTCSKGLCKRR